MMRPRRAFIIPRNTSRASWNAGFRLVAMTASQSSSFIRTSRLSRVMPALFTRMPIAPWRASIPFTTVSTLAKSRTSSRTPSTLPGPACESAAIDAAPSSLVAVPTTRAPAAASARAIARPMPRVAPVTSASLPIERSSPSSPSQSASAERASANAAPSVSANASSRSSIRRVSPASTLPGPHSTIAVTPSGREPLHRLGPAHRARRLACQRGHECRRAPHVRRRRRCG